MIEAKSVKHQTLRKPADGNGHDIVYAFELGQLFPGRKLFVNSSIPIMSLVAEDAGKDIKIIAQRILTDAEIRMLLPILSSSTYCQQEVLCVSYACTYELLINYMFNPTERLEAQWNLLIQEKRHRLYVAHQEKNKRLEMRGVYNALFGLRRKLEQFGLTIRTKKAGYYLSLYSKV